MIAEINIDGFRCFNHTHLKGFEQINLLGGKNNSGKTALLEAIMLACQPNEITLAFLRNTLRKESQEMLKSMPNKVWENLFYQKQNKEILLELTANQCKYQIIFQKQQTYSNKLDISFNKASDFRNYDAVIHYDDVRHYMVSFDANATPEYKMQVGTRIPQNERLSGDSPVIDGDKHSDRPFIYRNLKTLFNLPIDNVQLATKYNELELNSQEDIFLQALKSIDESIDKVKISIIGESILYARHKGEKNFLPLTLFGDAMNSIAKLIFAVLDAKDGVLLIDEIENGIHYTNHAKVWKLLFTLAKQHNVQIFATTHSKELIEAFAKVAVQKECSSAYFEMAIHAKTNEIIGTKILPDVLAYRLAVDKPLRGEL